MREASPIPYRSGYKVQAWIDRHPDFTNPDPRLRPSFLMPPQDIGPHDYRVTERTFPELYARYKAMCEQAGLNPIPQLGITDSIKHAGQYNHSQNTIWLNMNVVNKLTWGQLLFSPLGHEVGHAWRYQNPDAADFPIPRQSTPRRQAEYEASMLSVCVNNSAQNMFAWMKDYTHGQPDKYPTNLELRESVARLPWSACPFPSGPVNLQPPPFLRAPAVKQK